MFPPSIKSVDITLSEGVEYESYVYKFTNLIDGKIYIGYHKGRVNDGYWESSQHPEFRQLFSGTEKIFHYEIIAVGSDFDMKNLEHKFLKQSNAISNPMFYNQSNGSPAATFNIRENLCSEFVKRYQNGEFDVDNEPFSEHVNEPFLQVRDEEFIVDVVREIADIIDELGGSIKNCCPILYIGYRRINGNHTYRAIEKSKKATMLPVARPSDDVLKEYNFSEAEIEYIALLCNKREEKIRTPTQKEDLAKYLVKLKKENPKLPLDGTDVAVILRNLGVPTKRARDSIINKATRTYAEDAASDANLVWVKWSEGNNKSEMEAVVSSKISDQTTSFFGSSGMSDKLIVNFLHHVVENSNKPNVIVVIYHPGADWQKKWQSGTCASTLTTMQKTLDLMQPIVIDGVEVKRKVSFHEMYTHKSDGSAM
jgi:hypothetical protein